MHMEIKASLVANFTEEASSKIPALTLLTNLGYGFIPPAQCEVLRGNKLASEKRVRIRLFCYLLCDRF